MRAGWTKVSMCGCASQCMSMIRIGTFSDILIATKFSQIGECYETAGYTLFSLVCSCEVQWGRLLLKAAHCVGMHANRKKHITTSHLVFPLT